MIRVYTDGEGKVGVVRDVYGKRGTLLRVECLTEEGGWRKLKDSPFKTGEGGYYEWIDGSVHHCAPAAFPSDLVDTVAL